jgi:hypothetical protein
VNGDTVERLTQDLDSDENISQHSSFCRRHGVAETGAKWVNSSIIPGQEITDNLGKYRSVLRLSYSPVDFFYDLADRK